jgi:hypothetical protein
MFGTLPATPPLNMVMPASGQTWGFYLNLIPAAVALLIALNYWRTSRSVAGLLCLLGGAISILNEPLVDNLGLVWFAPVNSWVLYKAWGISVPMCIFPAYVWYVGGQAFLSYWLYRRGLSKRGLFLLYAFCAITDVIMEVPAIQAGSYTYYGSQPFVFFKFPLWWAIPNSLMPMIMGGVMFKLEPFLQGIKRLLAIPMLWMIGPAANGLVAAPVWLALHLPGDNAGFSLAAGFVSLGMGMLACYGLGVIVGKDSKVSFSVKTSSIQPYPLAS